MLVPFSYRYESATRHVYEVVTDVVLAVPVGAFAATFLPRRDGITRSVSRSLFWGIAIVVGVEFLKLFVMSRYADTTHVITGGLGVAVGVLGTRYVRGRSLRTVTTARTHRIGLLCLAPVYILVLLSVFWAPYNFTLADKDLIHQRTSHFFGVPLAHALEGDDLSALNGFLQKFLLFAPVGAWIAFVVKPLDRAWRVASTVGLFCLTASLALVIELGKILLPSRSAAFDHVVICTIGSLVGLIAMNHLMSFKR